MMTTTRAPASPGRPTLLIRTARAEWMRMWTVRSSWLYALVTAAVVLGFGTILGYDVHGDPPSQQPDQAAWGGGQITGMFGMFGLLGLAVVAATSDHGTGGIVPTLQWTPRRGVLLVARSAVIVVTTTVYGVVLVAGASLVVWMFAPQLGLPVGEGAAALADVAWVYATGGLLAVGLGLGLRSVAGGLVSVLALMLVLPILLGMLSFGWSKDLSAVLPGSGAVHLMIGDPMVAGVTTTDSRIVLVLWALAALVAGGWRLLRSDADR